MVQCNQRIVGVFFLSYMYLSDIVGTINIVHIGLQAIYLYIQAYMYIIIGQFLFSCKIILSRPLPISIQKQNRAEASQKMSKYYLQMTISFFIGQNFKQAYQYEKKQNRAHTRGSQKTIKYYPQKTFYFLSENNSSLGLPTGL